MADDKSSSGAWSGGIVVAGVAALSALYVALQPPPLVSNRPQQAEYPGHEIVAGQDIDARLWQDPFDAVARDIETGGDRIPRPGNEHLLTGNRDGLAIAVTLPGAPFPEIAETRRRLRYAVLAAMHFRGFMPEDEKHIGYFNSDDPPFITSVLTANNNRRLTIRGLYASTRRENGKSRIGSTGEATHAFAPPPLPKTIPFEQFEATEKSGPHVLLLWLDQDFLTSARQPIASLARLHSALAKYGYHRFAVLGPENSTTLAAMVREKSGPQGNKSDLDSFPIYNFGATAEEEKIVESNYQKNDESRDITLQSLFADYHKVVTTDKELAQTLACELDRRDPGLHIEFDLLATANCKSLQLREHPGKNHIVLISDWDTVYGYDLVKTVQEALEKLNPAEKSWVTISTYLRGLDGRLPNHRGAGQKALSRDDDEAGRNSATPAGYKPPSVATPENASQFESAEGQSQFDYLRRLAAELKARDAKFRRDPNDGGHIAAIGVLGSDVYDKLLILQALRPEFPNANFFTTDLDALLLPDKKSHYTRNLLVASSYGLQLDPSLTCDIPAFRNSYQTSIFVAAARALHKTFPKRNGSTCKMNAAINSDAPPEPLLFQIGRTSPQPLPTAPLVSAAADPPEGSLQTLSQVQAADIGIVRASWGARLAVFLIPLLLIGCVFIPTRVRHDCFARLGRHDQPSYWRWPNRIAASFVVLVVLALWASLTICWEATAQWMTEKGVGDPISVFEGVSIWPTIALRAAGFLLALILIWYTLRALEVNRQETLGRYNELHDYKRFRDAWSDLRQKENMSRGAAIWALLWFRPIAFADLNQRDDDLRAERSLGDIVPEPSGHWMIRCLRAFIATVVMFLFLILLSYLLPDSTLYIPARGRLAQSGFWLVSLVGFIAALFLTFLVADATLYSRAFIKRLTTISTIWGQQTFSKYKTLFQLLDQHDVRDWIDLQFLAERTRCINKLIYFPFLVLAILIFSRSRLFDDFSITWSVVIPYGASMCILIGAVVAYRATAEKARRVAARRLTDRIIAAKGGCRDATADQLEKLLAYTQEMREGAFAPWASQPLVRALLLPLLTYGGTMLVDLYALPGI
jgi:hypothetical protein